MANYGKGTKKDPYTNIVEYICEVSKTKLYTPITVKHPDDLRDIHGKLICGSHHVHCYYNGEDYKYMYKSKFKGGIDCWRNEKGDVLPIDTVFDKVVYYKRTTFEDLNTSYYKIGNYKEDAGGGAYYIVGLYYAPDYDVHFII